MLSTSRRLYIHGKTSRQRSPQGLGRVIAKGRIGGSIIQEAEVSWSWRIEGNEERAEPLKPGSIGPNETKAWRKMTLDSIHLI